MLPEPTQGHDDEPDSPDARPQERPRPQHAGHQRPVSRPAKRTWLRRLTGRGRPGRRKHPTHCSYCGAELNPRYYFCLECALPYKDEESVLPRPRAERLTDGKLIEKKAPDVWRVFWTYFAVILSAGVLAAVVFGEDRPDLAYLLADLTLLVTTCIFTALHLGALLPQFKQFGFHRPAAIIALLALVPLLGLNYVYHGWLIEALQVETADPFTRLRELGVGESTLVFVFCVFPAVIEEIAFRGLVQHWLQAAIRPMRALVLASALFTVLHLSVISAPYLFAVGMLLGWAKWKTGSLYPSILIHFLHNLVVLEFFPH